MDNIREKFLSGKNRKMVKVTVDGIGEINVMQPSVEDVHYLREMAKNSNKETSFEDMDFNQCVETFITCLADDEGKPLFTRADVSELCKKITLGTATQLATVVSSMVSGVDESVFEIEKK